MTSTSIHGCMCAFKMASLCQETSTLTLSTFTYCIRASLCVRKNLCVVPLTSSYFFCSSHASVSRCYMFGSSCKVVRTSNDSSNSLVQSFTTLLTSTIATIIMLAHCFLTSSGVEGCTFNFSLVI